MSQRLLLFSTLFSTALFACGSAQSITEEISAPSATVAQTPTPTPEPLAASVNGEPISLAYFEEEFARYIQAQPMDGTDLATESEARFAVLNALIDLKLLAQGALDQGLSAQVDQRLREIEEELGGAVAFSEMLIENGYSQESFRSAMEESMLADAMVRSIVGEMPETVEQVHARHILVANREQAEELREEILNGEDFAAIARSVSLDLSTRPAGGDLGWFPGGLLTVAEVEETAFTLQPGELSVVIESRLGFHLVEVLERGQRAVHGEALMLVRQQAVESWLQAQRASADIEIHLSP